MLSKLGCVELQYLVSTLIHWLKEVHFNLRKGERQLLLRIGSYKWIALQDFTAGNSTYPARGFHFLCHRILFPTHILISEISANEQSLVNFLLI